MNRLLVKAKQSTFHLAIPSPPLEKETAPRSVQSVVPWRAVEKATQAAAILSTSPFAQLARKLVSIDAGIRVTFLTAAGTVPRVEAMLSSAPAGAVTVMSLNLPRVPGLPEGASTMAEDCVCTPA
ncbi:hypothetical protein HU200_022902 [Digitaria exilis]|uniref:Uncharacterized protein n=1 Tax=Digitaria exilis TaxID=1010633 RepID=A0A835CCG7_9POAL|nr:hypothetical protein HU200_022902 [Digitaria exilis]